MRVKETIKALSCLLDIICLSYDDIHMGNML